MSTTLGWGVGSKWHRWDPHIHAPGTLRNDLFNGEWDGYMRAIEQAVPPAAALGITDYFSLRAYKEVQQRRANGALEDVLLVFPNIEIRLTIETRDRQGINLHLLVSPDDSDHVRRMEEKLALLVWKYREHPYPCTDDALRRLGRAHRNDVTLSDDAALREGANQFKVELSDLRRWYMNDKWLQDNVLIAVAAGNDGLGGISRDASFHAQREELGRFAHIVFSGSPNDREYWLGRHPTFESEGQRPKPCLHGCDAHSVAAVLAPAQDRRCWLRGQVVFETLRQALVEPDRRVHIGDAPPLGAAASGIIRHVRVVNAGWFQPALLTLNDGLVAIIGQRGSGKTALADMVAFAADAVNPEPTDASFIGRAGTLLDGTEVEIEWADGTKERRVLGQNAGARAPRARYLSQQFVERLSSRSGARRREPSEWDTPKVIGSSPIGRTNVRALSGVPTFEPYRAYQLISNLPERPLSPPSPGTIGDKFSA